MLMADTRHEKIWGRKALELIDNAKIAIVGLDNAGMEIFKSAIMLGVGKIYLIDNELRDDETRGYFLDIPFDPNNLRSESLEKMFEKKENKNNQEGKDEEKDEKKKEEEKAELFHRIYNEIGDDEVLYTKFYKEMLKQGLEHFRIKKIKKLDKLSDDIELDAIFDTTNDPSSQDDVAQFSKEKNIDLYIGACNKESFEHTYLFTEEYPDKSVDEFIEDLEIIRYENQDQGLIASYLVSNIAVECFRKRLFEKNRNLLNYKNIDLDLQRFNKSVAYSLTSRTKRKDNPDLEIEAEFADKSILLCGCGAIGNAVADLLARLGAKKIDFIDFDVAQNHNIQRQPFFYDCIGKFKSKELSAKVKKMYKDIETDFHNKRIGKNLNKEWFAKNRYDLILGGFDSAPAREVLNRYSTELGLKYIDGGSAPDSGDVVTFVPGKTACLECTLGISELAKAFPDPVSCGDERITGNVNMSNRIVAALMVNEARKVLNPELGEPYNGKITYVNRKKGFNLGISQEHNKCPHDKNAS